MSSPGNPISSLLNTLFAGQDAKWGQSSLVNVLNTMNSANNTGLGLGVGSFAPANAGAQSNLGTAQNLLGSPTGGLGNLQEQIYGATNQITPGQFQQSGLQGHNGDVLNYMGNSTAQGALGAQDNNGMGSQAYMNLLAGGGNVNGSQQGALDALMAQINGGGTNGDLTAAGRAAVGNGGLNGYDSRLQALGDYNLSRNGYVDPNLTTLGNAGTAGVQNQGLTATGQQAQQTALGGVQRGGQTATTQALQGIGTNFAGQQALLPTALAASFAKDQAGQQARKSAADFQAQALARGGGAGSTVANGAANSGMADFADNIAQAQSNAYQNSLVQQQGLNLQQQGQGAQMALGAGNLAAGQLGTYGSLLTGQQGVQNQTYATGGNQLAAAAGGANASANTYGNLGVAGGQLGNNTLGIGTGALNNATGNQTSAAQGINGLTATQLQALLGAGSGLNANAGTANTAYNNNLNGQLGSQALGNTQANSYYSNLNNLFGSQTANNGTSLGLNNNALGNLTTLSGQGLDYAGKGLAGQANLFQQYASGGLANNQAAWNGLGQSTGPAALSGWTTAVQGASGSGGGGGD